MKNIPHPQRWPTIALILLCAGLLLAACAIPDPDDPQQAPPPESVSDDEDTPIMPESVTLEGTGWRLTGLAGPDGALLDPVLGSDANLIFQDGQLGGNAGCNGYFGQYELDGDALSISDVGSTLMYCANEALMDQESRFLAALLEVKSFAVANGELRLFDAEGELLATMAAEEPIGLTESPWLLSVLYPEEYDPDTAVSSPLAGMPVTAVFADDGQVAGSTGCNNYIGTYRLDGDRLQINVAGVTRMFCAEPAGVMEQEQAFLQALPATASYKIVDVTLTLLDAQGRPLITFIAAAVPDFILR